MALRSAILNGHFPIIKWLVENGEPINLLDLYNFIAQLAKGKKCSYTRTELERQDPSELSRWLKKRITTCNQN
ncbi:MAG: hypothetical protein DDT41_01677 [candidate division WS2 bacterium]|nr:hypothetical protein [Candidatus Psychracetigena formicireducens]